jgi:hypothetical protein
VPVLHECGCLTSNATERHVMDNLKMQINNVTQEVAAAFAALNDPKFTAVAQPGIEDTDLTAFPKNVAIDLVSDVDCFHPSLCTDQNIAIAIWNNMFTPSARKKRSLDPLNIVGPYCPTESDVLM